MRITYRNINNKDYWAKRWENIPADLPMENRDSYPLKYAELTVSSKDGTILEAGCGAGRLLRYYKDRGYNIVGIDFIEGAIEKLKKIDPQIKAEVGDITQLRFPDESFRFVLAFGLYHNLEHGLEKALRETHRVLEKGGLVCASFRADNLQTKLNDWLEEHRSKNEKPSLKNKQFHKINLTRGEILEVFKRNGFEIKEIYTAENMPILYKFAFFRSKTHKQFDENKARKEGYQLGIAGRGITRFLLKFFPNQFCNIYVVIAQKPYA